jgi:hypothetical protein
MDSVALQQTGARIEADHEAHMREPFPYADCRYLLSQLPPEEHSSLIPDLDLYFSTLAGWASRAASVLTWPRNDLLRAREDLSRTFIEQHPEHARLESLVSETATPVLARELTSSEALRRRLLELILAVQR